MPIPSSPRRRAPSSVSSSLDQELLAALGAGVDDLAGLEAEPHARRPRGRRSPPAGGSVTSPSTESSTGPVKNSPSGMLCSPSQGMNVRPAMPSVMSVPGAGDAHLLVALDPLGEPLGLLRGALPGGQRVGVGRPGRRRSRSPRSRPGSSPPRRRRRWSGTACSAQRKLALGAALHRPLHQRLPVAAWRARLALRRRPAESSRVLVLAPIAIRTSALSTAHSAIGRDPVELRVGGVLEVGRRLARRARR